MPPVTPDPARRPARPAAADPPAGPIPAQAPPASADGTPPGRPAGRGADLARDALAAARDANAAKRRAAGRNPLLRTGGSMAGRRRRRWSGSGPDARDPQPLAATIRTWVAQAGAAADLTRAQIFGRWSQVVGEEVAAHCAPVSLTDGELVVQAESTAWATQIRMLAPQLVRRINTELGDRVVTRIRARGPSGPSWRFGSRHVPGRGPRDTYG